MVGYGIHYMEEIRQVLTIRHLVQMVFLLSFIESSGLYYVMIYSSLPQYYHARLNLARFNGMLILLLRSVWGQIRLTI